VLELVCQKTNKDTFFGKFSSLFLILGYDTIRLWMFVRKIRSFMEEILMKNVIGEIENARVMNQPLSMRMKLEGELAFAVRFIERNQLCDVNLWKKFVQVFRDRKDGEKVRWVSWRTEFWGKMMRGCSMVVSYTQDDGMYRILEASVRDMLTAQDAEGSITGYSKETEFGHWDLWGRKYVMLGMMYFLEICRDRELEEKIIEALCRHADYILAHVGEGKMDIRLCSAHWEGLNSCSILEPMVRLYRLTGEQKYFDFATYIISTGFIQSANLIELAYADEVAPHDYPVVKAYEMMSCFEGLLQYYYVTGIEKYKTAVLNFGRRILDGELSIIGCSGCTHELFDHTAVKQTQTDYAGIVQETCVTVTWMKFASALLMLSGDVAFADAIERSFYNAYLGAMNLHRVPFGNYPKEKDVPQVLPFDSYSPLVADRRGRKVGGYGIFDDGTFYGCCACIVGAGAGTIPTMALLCEENGFVLNYFEQGVMNAQTSTGKDVTFKLDTAYPFEGVVKICVGLSAPEHFALRIRIPAWCESATICVDGKELTFGAGYATVEREWQDGDVLTLKLPMEVQRVLPPKGARNEDVFAAYQYGPLVLAADRRLTAPDAVLPVACDDRGRVSFTRVLCPKIPESKLCLAIPLESGEEIRLIEYASAGKTWTDESAMAAWLRRK